jgi:hypothetical protein
MPLISAIKGERKYTRMAANKVPAMCAIKADLMPKNCFLSYER